MAIKPSSAYQVPSSYDEFKKIAKPIAANFVKNQKLSHTALPEKERIENAIEDAFMKKDKYVPSKGAKFTSFIYPVLRNEIYTIPDYDKDFLRSKSEIEDEDGSPHIIKEAYKSLNGFLEEIQVSEEQCEHEFGHIDCDSNETPCDPYDRDDCFKFSFTQALANMNESDKLILSGNKHEYVKVKGVLHDDEQAWEDHYSKNKGTVVTKRLSRAEIGKLLNYSAQNVGFIRNKLTKELALAMSETFVKIYLGPYPQGTFNRMLNQYSRGNNFVKKNSPTL